MVLLFGVSERRAISHAKRIENLYKDSPPLFSLLRKVTYSMYASGGHLS
jgi:hypothetical protein